MTICNAHKATMLCSDSAKTRGVSLNTDGTTKHQKKLGVVANSVSMNYLMEQQLVLWKIFQGHSKS